MSTTFITSARARSSAVTLMSTSSRSTVATSLKSVTFTTWTILLSCFVICSRTRSSPVVTSVIRDIVGSNGLDATHRLSMLKPRPLNRPATRASTPNSFSTRTEGVCCCFVNPGPKTLARSRVDGLGRLTPVSRQNRHHAILADELDLLNALLFQFFFRGQVVFVIEPVQLLLEILVLRVEASELGHLV